MKPTSKFAVLTALAALLSGCTPGAAAAPGWMAWLGYGALAVALLVPLWRSQQQRLEREASYSRRLEDEVRARTRELHDRNAELKALNDKLLEASLTDPLTGLRNRRFLFEELTKDIDLVRRWHEERDGSEQGDPFNIVFLIVDLDHFKPVNDTCGHAAGDRVLLQVRDVLLNACRSSDFVVRWGGDEFVVVSRNARPGEIESLAERIRANIAETVFSLGDGQVVRTTCSVGFASFPFVDFEVDLMPWEQVLGLADTALYVAKGQRNAWVGFLSTDESAGYPRLFHAVRDDPFQVEADGALVVRSSALPTSRKACL